MKEAWKKRTGPKCIDKVCSRDFWKGRDSYRTLQNNFYDYITSKGFKLERGIEIEQTGAKHEIIEDFKKITNFENTKKVLDNIKLELPEIPDINDIRIIKFNREKFENEIIKSKDKLINELYQDNKNLYRELSRKVNLVDKATKYEKERKRIMHDNEKLHNEVDKLPFAVFICTKSNAHELEDYKQVFTDIISDRIKEKYK